MLLREGVPVHLRGAQLAIVFLIHGPSRLRRPEDLPCARAHAVVRVPVALGAAVTLVIGVGPPEHILLHLPLGKVSNTRVSQPYRDVVCSPLVPLVLFLSAVYMLGGLWALGHLEEDEGADQEGPDGCMPQLDTVIRLRLAIDLLVQFLNLLLLFLNLHGLVLPLSPDRRSELVGGRDEEPIFFRRPQNDYQEGVQAGSLEPPL